MWTPDIRTLFLILFLVNVFFTLILFIFWKTQKTYHGFKTWILSLLVISCGYLLFILRGSVSDFLSIIIANILIALSVMMRVDSIRKYFWSKPLSPVFYSILIPFAGLFLYYTYSIDSVLLRSLISNMIVVPCLLITGLLAIRSQEPDNRLLRFSFAATFIVVGILLTVRSISWLITPQNQSLFSTDLLNSYYFVVTIITDIIGIGIFLMLNMARSQRELRASDEKFGQLFTRMPSAVAIYDAVDGGEDFIFKDFNEAAEKIEGRKKDDLVGKRLTQVFPGVKDFGVFDVFCRVWRTGQPEFFPSALYRDERDPGTWRESRVYKLASGEVVAIYDDITKRKQAEEAVRVHAEIERNMSEAAYLIRVSDAAIVYSNPAFEHLLGYNPGELIGRHVSIVNAPVDKTPDDIASDIISSLEQTGSWTGDVLNLRKDGSTIWCHANVLTFEHPVYGRVWLSMHQDITERKRAGVALKAEHDRMLRYLDVAGVMLTVLDREGTVTLINRKGCEILGYAEEEILGRNWFDLVLPEDVRGEVKGVFTRIMNGDLASVEYYENPVLTKTNEKRIIAFHNTYLTDPDGISGVLFSGEDITDIKRVEEALQESEKTFRALAENANDGILVAVAGGTHAFANQRAGEISGYGVAELLKTSIRDLAAPDELGKIVENFRKRLAGKDLPKQYETSIIRKDRKIIPIELTSSLISWHGQPADLVIFRDITERKMAENALRQANKKLNLLSGITRHDISNQLTVLLGHLNRLEKKRLDPVVTDPVSKAATAARRISSIIQFTKEYESIGVNAPVWQDCRTVIDTAAKQAPLGKVVVKNDLPAGAEVFADPLVIKVFYNLMDNAVRYGGKITTIRFSVEEAGDDHLIVCKDDGEGVVAEEKEKIFERGFGKNTGLGLALSREILSITGITIRETGELGKGARFEMTVPKGAWRMTGNGA
jgi:PAS domain S-box-containing protein